MFSKYVLPITSTLVGGCAIIASIGYGLYKKYPSECNDYVRDEMINAIANVAQGIRYISMYHPKTKEPIIITFKICQFTSNVDDEASYTFRENYTSYNYLSFLRMLFLKINTNVKNPYRDGYRTVLTVGSIKSIGGFGAKMTDYDALEKFQSDLYEPHKCNFEINNLITSSATVRYYRTPNKAFVSEYD